MAVNPLISQAREKMEKSIASVKTELMHIRTGRASVALLDEVKLDYYGTPTPISQVASISVSESRTLLIKPWDRTLLPLIEKAILASQLGITPVNDGSVIRLNFPSPTTDQRKNLVKKSKEIVENGKVAIRNIRRDILKVLKEQKDEGKISEDDEKSLEESLQKLTDEYVKKLDTIFEEKEKEIMEF
ncbi:MAG: ribosome recycling factor [Mesoaciditoga sp.]|uniref:ribosome recycling factor n=1 Tax=Athalassotoga sp. TaxID=2022597 RepID=UPI000CB8211B|nr:MAG: ribosome recycling factor [Mesoaciditoga sp.]PMP79140.1 MAG: ribosome recycling factor [Mesoaciditoga sp.]HEU24578.1 ribosome recycling factor [Mesoaciditoga lauensis]